MKTLTRHLLFQMGIFLIFLFSAEAFSNSDPMPVDRAFQLSAQLHEDQVVFVHFNIAPNYYLYENKLKFQIKKPESAVLGRILMPKAEEKQDAFLGKQAVYQGAIVIPVPILNWEKGELLLQVDYQGCSSQGYCYPSTERLISLKADAQTGKIQSSDPVQESNRALAWLARQPLWLIPFGFIGFGLLLSLTPCTLPMIPILSSIILGYRGHLTTTKAFLLSLTYVVSMASVYALIGVLAGFLGNNFQMAFQKTWVIVLFSSLFIGLALCSFAGFYKLKLPVFLEKHVLKISHSQKRGTYIGVAIMGALSTLIVSPCVTAPLIGVISYISQTGHAGLGGMALFFMGLGMGVPLLIIGTLEARWLPKSGHWTHIIEIILGFLLLGIAIDLLSKILPGNFILSLWGALFLIGALYTGGFSSREKITARTLRRGFAIVLMVYGLSLMVGGLMGSEDFFAPLKKITEKTKGKEEQAFKVVTSLKALDEALEEAKQQHKNTLVDFYANWCVYCKIMDKTLFKDSEVLGKIENFQRIKVDITQVNAESNALLQRFNLIAPPALLFFDPLGKEVAESRLVGEVQKEVFLKQLNKRAPSN